jgi:transitional endoplasmic reticulum ATPase
LLNEMDGVSGQAQGLLVLAATNRRGAVDAALLRPGRLQESLLVPYPRPDLDYLPILQVATRRMPLHTAVDLPGLVTNVLKPLVDGGEGNVVTPANLVALCREAGLACMRETEGEGGEGGREGDADLVVCQEHFVQAATKLWGGN